MSSSLSLTWSVCRSSVEQLAKKFAWRDVLVGDFSRGALASGGERSSASASVSSLLTSASSVWDLTTRGLGRRATRCEGRGVQLGATWGSIEVHVWKRWDITNLLFRARPGRFRPDGMDGLHVNKASLAAPVWCSVIGIIGCYCIQYVNPNQERQEGWGHSCYDSKTLKAYIRGQNDSKFADTVSWALILTERWLTEAFWRSKTCILKSARTLSNKNCSHTHRLCLRCDHQKRLYVFVGPRQCQKLKLWRIQYGLSSMPGKPSRRRL
jgi:hypothetical protein